MKTVNYIFISMLALLPGFMVSQTVPNAKYFGKDYFLIEGTRVPESEKESPYDRLPLSLKEKVRGPVWSLSKNSAGISLRFFSNSTLISARWKLLSNQKMNHMAETGIKGVDLYCKTQKGWQYINTGRPSDTINEALLINNLSREMREYRLYLPLYDGVTSVEIGIDSASEIKKAEPGKGKPVVFYGTSITQGGCASRTGMAHTNIISRKLGIEVINFGFSGNGRMEQPIAELISRVDAQFYVIECVPNMSVREVQDNTIPLVLTIRSKHAATPIVFIEGTYYEKYFFDDSVRIRVDQKNKILRDQYDKMKKEGFKNIYYIPFDNAVGTDHEATVDGVHYTDLGFLRYADYLITRFKKLKLISNQRN